VAQDKNQVGYQRTLAAMITKFFAMKRLNVVKVFLELNEINSVTFTTIQKRDTPMQPIHLVDQKLNYLIFKIGYRNKKCISDTSHERHPTRRVITGGI
jgi:hypothetical protein